DLRREPWMAAVKVPQRAVTVSGENRDRRILLSFAIFAAEIVLESAVAGAEQAQSVPASFASPRAQRRWISRSHNCQIDILGDVMSYAIKGIDPGSAHRARSGLLLPKHEMIDDQ